jgi:hypothetical protein
MTKVYGENAPYVKESLSFLWADKNQAGKDFSVCSK